MEMGCLSLNAASTPPTSAVFRRNSTHLSYTNSHHSIPASSSAITNRRHGNLTVKALKPSTSKPAAPLPKFQDLNTTNMLLNQRIIYLGSQIDDLTADFVINQLLLLDAEDQKKDIKMFISSPGGSTTAAMGIYDAMKLCKADISTISMGTCAYMGAFLLAAGTKGKRFCMPNARLVLRKPQSAPSGLPGLEMVLRHREAVYSQLKMAKILSRITGKPEEQVISDIDRNFYLSAWEAKDYGLVDGVIDDGKPGLVAPVVEAVAPPKTQIWYLWKYDMDDTNLPDEDKLLQQNKDRVAE